MLFQNKSLKNASWIIACRVMQSLLSFLVGMLTARYLGPSGYGLVSYAAALVAFVTPLTHLGLRSTLVQEVISKPEQEGEVLGSAVGCSLVSSVACIVGVVAFAAATNPGSRETVVVCALYSLLLLVKAGELFTFWFRAKLLSKYPSIMMLVAYGVVSAYKIALLVAGSSIYWFALSNAIDGMVIAIGLLIFYHKLHGQPLKFSWKQLGSLLQRSKYYILPSMMLVIAQQTDRIMLKAMIDEAATGCYSAAVSCTGIFGFVFNAIVESFQPTVLESRKRSREEFETKLSYLYCVVIYLALAQSLVFTLLAEPAVMLIYGQQYAPAIGALRIVVWQTPFAYLGVIMSTWILGENKHKYLWILSVTGMVVNVTLNLLLIPKLGILGAALASVLMQVVKNFLVVFAIPELRGNNRIFLRGLHPKTVLELVRAVFVR